MTRLNARIDQQLAEKIEKIRAATHMSVTEIVRASIELYYERFEAEHPGRARRALERSGFVGCTSGDPSLSTRYKEALTDSWSEKAGATTP